MLDPDRADLDAGHALHARPERLLSDDAAGDRLRDVEERPAAESGPDAEGALRHLPQVEDEVARRERVAGRASRARLVALTAFRARVEVDEVPRREGGDRRVADVLGLRVGRQRSQALTGLLVPKRHARGAGKHVDGLRERDRRHEPERDNAVDPPLDEPRVVGSLAREPDGAEGVADEPADRRPDLDGRAIHGDAERLEQEAGQGQEEDDAEEGPVPDYVAAPVVLALGTIDAPVAEPEGPEHAAADRHDRDPDHERCPEDVEEGGVGLVEPARPELEAERGGDVVLKGQDRGSDEEDEEAVEDEQVAEPCKRVAPADPCVREDGVGCARDSPHRGLRVGALEPDSLPAAAVLLHEPVDAPEEDRRRDEDEEVPEGDLPRGQAVERLAGGYLGEHRRPL